MARSARPACRDLAKSVAVVDDDPNLRLLLRVRLGLAGCIVVSETSTFSEAAGHLSACAPDVIVLDVLAASGVAVDAVGEARLAVPTASIVVFSALPRSAALVEAVAADAYVSKLEGTDRLLDVIAAARPRLAA